MSQYTSSFYESEIKKQIEANQRQLRILEERVASKGTYADRADPLEIEYIKTRIAELEAQITQLAPSRTTVSLPRVAPQTQGAVRIFLSYAREDFEKVEQLYRDLQALRFFKPWMDCHDILGGEDRELTIQKAIRSADFFVVCLSSDSVNKRGWVQRELKKAFDIWKEKLDSDIYLIPVRLDECQVPDNLAGFQWVDLFKADGQERLLQAIRVGLERRQG